MVCEGLNQSSIPFHCYSNKLLFQAGRQKKLKESMSSTDLYLPDECWESVFKFLLLDHHRCLEPLSLVSKQFLSITSRLRSSLTICDPTLPYLPRLLTRFPTLASLDLSRFRGDDLHALLYQISLSPHFLTCRLHSLNISNCKLVWAVEGMEEEEVPLGGGGGEANNGIMNCFSFLKTMILEHLELAVPNTRRHRRRSFTMSLHIIAHYFPFLEELDISFLKGPISDIDVEALSLALPKLRRVNLSGNRFINNSSFFHLCKNCQFLEQVVIFGCKFITCDGIASAIKTRPNLTSLSFSVGDKITRLSSEFIASLVSLKSLTCIELPYSTISDEMLFSIAEEGLPLRKLGLKCCHHQYSYAGIFCLLSKCKLVQHLDLQGNVFLEDEHISKLSVFLANLMSINLMCCKKLTNLSFFALTRHCPLLSEINMVQASLGGESGALDSLMDLLVVNYQMKSLHLTGNRRLRDEDIKIFAFICPNLQLLDLSLCPGISEGVVEVLKRCPKIRHLNLASNSGVKLFGLNFQVPILEVLNLSYCRIDDDALFIISQCFCWLLHLEMKHCSEITGKGVAHVVENCKQLREINLRGCNKVAANVIEWMVFSRPSLRKILTPLFVGVSERQRELFLRHGCVVVSL